MRSLVTRCAYSLILRLIRRHTSWKQTLHGWFHGYNRNTPKQRGNVTAMCSFEGRGFEEPCDATEDRRLEGSAGSTGTSTDACLGTEVGGFFFGAISFRVFGVTVTTQHDKSAQLKT
jgi:hypothetical protein